MTLPYALVRHHFEKTSSTQSCVKELLSTLAPDTCVLCTAEEQTEGRGTKNRVWMSPPDVNIYASYGVLIPLSKRSMSIFVPQVIAHALLMALNSFLKEKIKIEFKWINDLMTHQKKIGGILCEAQTPFREKYTAWIIGIGLNINMDPSLGATLSQPITSLKAETGITYNKEIILTHITTQILTNLMRLLEHGFTPFHSFLSSHMAFLHELITFDTEDPPRGILQGIVKGLGENGELLLETSPSHIEKFMAGKIVTTFTNDQ